MMEATETTTWNELVEMEPRLKEVERHAYDYHREYDSESPDWTHYSKLKKEFSKLVGWVANSSRSEVLCSNEAYDVVLKHIVDIWETGKAESSNWDRMWIACTHVFNGTAKEVWCHPQQVACCPECAERGPHGLSDSELHAICPVCLLDTMKSMSPVYMRELVEEDAIKGHAHDSDSTGESW
jgi:hypothetical protein